MKCSPSLMRRLHHAPRTPSRSMYTLVRHTGNSLPEPLSRGGAHPRALELRRHADPAHRLHDLCGFAGSPLRSALRQFPPASARVLLGRGPKARFVAADARCGGVLCSASSLGAGALESSPWQRLQGHGLQGHGPQGHARSGAGCNACARSAGGAFGQRRVSRQRRTGGVEDPARQRRGRMDYAVSPPLRTPRRRHKGDRFEKGDRFGADDGGARAGLDRPGIAKPHDLQRHHRARLAPNDAARASGSVARRRPTSLAQAFGASFRAGTLLPWRRPPVGEGHLLAKATCSRPIRSDARSWRSGKRATTSPGC